MSIGGLPGLQPVVLDTDVVSFIYKDDSRGARYAPYLVQRLPIISFMTLAELECWAGVRRWGTRSRERLRRLIARYTVHFPDENLCVLWAAVNLDARRAGRPISTADAWIAATALRYDVPLLTHNASDYAGVSGLKIITEP